jgi:hypothetical protein
LDSRVVVTRMIAEMDSWIEELAAQQQHATPSVDMSIRYLSILRALRREAMSALFWAPVDPIAVPSYRHYVKRPMDLRTISERVRSGHYDSDTSGQAFAEVLPRYPAAAVAVHVQHSSLMSPTSIYALLTGRAISVGQLSSLQPDRK